MKVIDLSLSLIIKNDLKSHNDIESLIKQYGPSIIY